jgi:hypothetical protein
MIFFRSKTRNRRKGHVQVLDVKLRSDQVRRTRVRAGLLAGGVLLGTLLGAFALWRGGEWVLDQTVYQNSAFAIERIEVSNDGIISAPQLCRWAGVRAGQNLIALDIARVKRNLEMVPALETVAVERVLPRTLRIRVTEREPVVEVAVLQTNRQGGLENRIFHLDAHGVVMPPLPPQAAVRPLGQPDAALPRLIGLKQMDLQPAQPVSSRAARAAIQLAVEFACSPMGGLVNLKSIDITPGDVLSVITEQGSEVTFALDQINVQLGRWRQVHDEGLRKGKGSLASLDLSVANNAPARWLEARATPPAVKPPKTNRTKKPHV